MNPLKRGLPPITTLSTQIRRLSTTLGIQKQVHPLHGYYKLLLENPLPPTPSSSSPPPSPPFATTPTTSAAPITFTGPLAGPPSTHAPAKPKPGRTIAGVHIPPKPTGPDPGDCCMSGCVNCVWEVFREDLEEWRGRVALAKAKGGNVEDLVDGGEGGLWEGFEDLPVGIRAFVETEKRLKEGGKKKRV